MNIIKREWKQGWKPFLLWALGTAFLVLGGMVKFVGASEMDGGGLGAVLSQIPRPVLALFGMAEADIETFGGFYSVLQFYAMIVICCYAVWLGTGSVLSESVDKTYEFLFTKPCGRLYILGCKLSAGFTWLTALCVLNGLFSYLAPALYGIENTIPDKMPLFACALYVVALLFFAAGALFSVLAARPEWAVRLSYGLLFAAYGLSVAFDAVERLGFLRFFTPFRYFRAGELLEGRFPMGYLAASLLLTAVFLAVSFLRFQRKDLTAA